MNKKTKVSSSVPGTEDFDSEEIVKGAVTREMVHDFLKKDLMCAINCLDAVYRDQDLLNSMVDFMYGRYQNAKHKESLLPDVKVI